MNIQGVTIIKSETHGILTLMRLGGRWAQKGRRKADREIPYTLSEGPLVKSFRSLNQYLEGAFDLREVDSVVYLSPFHQVVVSAKASGPLTSAALNSLSKFLLYGFLCLDYPRAMGGMMLIADCISRCVFEETDRESDEVIFMKMLELSVLAFRCEASQLLTVQAAWNIYNTCIGIHDQHKASKILRSEAETTLRHLTLTAFSRAYFHTTQMIKTGPLTNLDFFGEPLCFSAEGITLLLVQIMTALANLMDPQSSFSRDNREPYVKFALSLTNIALEAGGPALDSMTPLVEILRGDVSRHLLQASQSEDLELFSLSLRVVFNLFMSIKNHMKVQLEVFLTSVHLRVLQLGVMPVSPRSSSASSLQLAREELVLESLLEFCREPSLLYDLYSNYDCDVQCTNLFDAIIKTLCIRSSQDEGLSYSSPDMEIDDKPTNRSILNYLALGGVFAALNAVASQVGIVSFSKTHAAVVESDASVMSLNNVHTVSSVDSLLISTGVDVKPTSHRFGGDSQELDAAVDSWCSVDPAAFEDSTNDVKTQSVKNIDISTLRHYFRAGPLSRSSSMASDESLVTFDSIGVFTKQQAKRLEDLTNESFKGTDSVALHEIIDDANGIEFYPQHIVSERLESDTIGTRLHNAQTTVEVLRQRKLKKQHLREAAEKFNSQPLKPEWLQYALDLGLLTASSASNEDSDSRAINSQQPQVQSFDSAFSIADSKSVAKFLKNTPNLGKTQVGEFLSRGPTDRYPFHAAVLCAYVDTFDFSGPNCTFVRALRLFLGQFRLPGEAQCIDRLMEAFSRHLFTHLGVGQPFASSDAVFVLAFSTIMLNTDLHNHNLVPSKKMTRGQFVQNNRGINDGSDLPPEYLESLFDEIRLQQIQVDSELTDYSRIINSGVESCLTDASSWHRMLRRAAHQAPASFTPTVAARWSASRGRIVLEMVSEGSLHLSHSVAVQEREMFIVMAPHVAQTIDDALSCMYNKDDLLVGRLLQAALDFCNLCSLFGLGQPLSRLFETLATHADSLFFENTENSLTFFGSDNDAEEIEKQGETQKEKVIRFSDLEALIGASFNDQLCTPFSIDSNLDQSPHLRWFGARYVRGELILRVLFIMAERHGTHLDSSAWTALFSQTLRARNFGALPSSLALIRDEFAVSEQQQLSKYVPSAAALQCHHRARQSDKQATFSENRGILLSLAGIFWGGSEKKSDRCERKYGNQDILDGNSCSSSVAIQAQLITIVLTNCNASVVLLGQTLSIKRFQLEACLGLLRAKLAQMLDVQTENDEEMESYGKNDAAELEVVLLLEWASVLVLSAESQFKDSLEGLDTAMWIKLSGFLLYAISRISDEGVSLYPYLLERVVLVTLRATTQILKFHSAKKKSRAKIESSDAIICLDSLWQCLRTLTTVPHEIMVGLDGRVGLAIQDIFSSHHSISCSIKHDLVLTPEQWQVILSLVAASCDSPAGNRGTWAVLSTLVDGGHGTHLNVASFPAITMLSMIFLNYNFRRNVNDDVGNSTAICSPFVADALQTLVFLSAASLAGGMKSPLTSSENSLAPNSVVDFALPPTSSLVEFPNANRVLSVRAINIPRIDSENFWIDSIRKICALWGSEAQNHADSCLRVLFACGTRAELSAHLWSKAISIMLRSLPLLLNHKSELLPSSLSTSSSDDKSVAASCALFCDVLLSHRVAHRSSLEFTEGWHKFCIVLSSNAQSASKSGRGDLCGLLSETVEEAAALVRSLLPSIPTALVSDPVKTPLSSPVGKNADSTGYGQAFLRFFGLKSESSPGRGKTITESPIGSCVAGNSPPHFTCGSDGDSLVLNLNHDTLSDCRLLTTMIKEFSIAGPALCRSLAERYPQLTANARLVAQAIESGTFNKTLTASPTAAQSTLTIAESPSTTTQGGALTKTEEVKIPALRKTFVV